MTRLTSLRGTMRWAVLLGVVTLASPVLADPPGHGGGQGNGGGHGDGKGHGGGDAPGKALADQRKAVHEAAQSGDAGALHQAIDDFKAAREKLRETRKARREAERDAAKATWGDLIDKAAVKAEMREHAERSARLDVIEKLAESRGNAALAKRAKDLEAKENARHDKRVAFLKAHQGADPGAAAQGGDK